MLKDVYYIGDIIGWTGIVFADYTSNPMNNGANLYFNNQLVTEITFPIYVHRINNYAFYHCISLTSVTFNAFVTTSIGDCAFNHCSSLTSAIIPNSVTTMGKYIFSASQVTIYCEASSKPDGWDNWWNYGGYPVVWGYTGE